MHNPEYVVKKGFDTLFKNKGEVIPSVFNKFSLILLKFIPDSLIR